MRAGLGQYRSVLVDYVGPLWRQALLLLAFLLAGVGLQLVSPYLLSQFIDIAIGGGTYPTLVRLAILFLVITIGLQLLSVAEAYVAENLGLRATNELRADLTEHVLGLDMTFHNGGGLSRGAVRRLQRHAGLEHLPVPERSADAAGQGTRPWLA